jgi:membrane associated rhomboid family serine protease
LIPLKDNQPTSTFPIVTILLIVVNVVAFLAQQFDINAITERYSLIPRELTHFVSYRVYPDIRLDQFGHEVRVNVRVPAVHPVWITVFTSMFLHGSWLHLGGNMLYLWIFGNNIEDALGKIKFTVFYFVSGIAAALAQVLVSVNSDIPVIGASGAIAGVLGAYYILYPSARVLSIVPIFGFGALVEVRAWLVLGLWFLLQVVQGIYGLGGMQGDGGVAVFAHIGGFVAGVVMINLFGGRNLANRQRRRTQYYPPQSGPYRYS